MCVLLCVRFLRSKTRAPKQHGPYDHTRFPIKRHADPLLGVNRGRVGSKTCIHTPLPYLDRSGRPSAPQQSNPSAAVPTPSSIPRCQAPPWRFENQRPPAARGLRRHAPMKSQRRLCIEFLPKQLNSLWASTARGLHAFWPRPTVTGGAGDRGVGMPCMLT